MPYKLFSQKNYRLGGVKNFFDYDLTVNFLKWDKRFIFFQWKLWCYRYLFQIRNPVGFTKLYFNLIFWFFSKKAEKTTNIAHLKTGADSHFYGRYVTKSKLFSKQDNYGDNFFQWKLRNSFFQISNPGGLPARRIPKLYFGFFLNSTFHVKIELLDAS